MTWLRRRTKEQNTARLPAFTQCAGCRYNFMTGEGTRSCNWYECPVLPEEYKVFCPECNYNFVTGEGSPRCTDPPTCEWSVEGYKHAASAVQRFGTLA